MDSGFRRNDEPNHTAYCSDSPSSGLSHRSRPVPTANALESRTGLSQQLSLMTKEQARVRVGHALRMLLSTWCVKMPGYHPPPVPRGRDGSKGCRRSVSWLPDQPTHGPFPAACASGFGRFRPRSQWRVRAGFSPASRAFTEKAHLRQVGTNAFQLQNQRAAMAGIRYQTASYLSRVMVSRSMPSMRTRRVSPSRLGEWNSPTS